MEDLKQAELFVLLAMAFFFLIAGLGNELDKRIEEDEKLIAEKNRELLQRSNQIDTLEIILDSLEKKLEGTFTTPPAIILAESNPAYRFELGSSEPSENFKSTLKYTISSRIERLLEKYNCNAVQIIGHTDGLGYNRQKISGSDASIQIDQKLGEFLYDPDVNLRATSNVELGMMRAISVLRILREVTHIFYTNDSGDEYSREPYWFPTSAGQLINEYGRSIPSSRIDTDIKKENPSRRRIEIIVFNYRK